MSDNFFSGLALFAGLFMLILGVMWFIFTFYEASRRKSWTKLTGINDWDFPITTFLKVLSYSGFVVGALSIVTGAAGLILDIPPSIAYSVETSNSVNYFTSILLIVLGIFTILKPLNDLPIASIAGFLIASFITILCIGIIMWLGVEISTSIAVGLIVLFVIIFAIVAITVKFYTALLMLLSKIISWPPFAFSISMLCFIQGVLLAFVGISIL